MRDFVNLACRPKNSHFSDSHFYLHCGLSWRQIVIERKKARAAHVPASERVHLASSAGDGSDNDEQDNGDEDDHDEDDDEDGEDEDDDDIEDDDDDEDGGVQVRFTRDDDDARTVASLNARADEDAADLGDERCGFRALCASFRANSKFLLCQNFTSSQSL